MTKDALDRPVTWGELKRIAARTGGTGSLSIAVTEEYRAASAEEKPRDKTIAEVLGDQRKCVGQEIVMPLSEPRPICVTNAGPEPSPTASDSDLVERLEQRAKQHAEQGVYQSLFQDAANEIRRLRALEQPVGWKEKFDWKAKFEAMLRDRDKEYQRAESAEQKLAAAESELNHFRDPAMQGSQRYWEARCKDAERKLAEAVKALEKIRDYHIEPRAVYGAAITLQAMAEEACEEIAAHLQEQKPND